MNLVHTKWKCITIISTTTIIIFLMLSQPIKAEGEDERSSQEEEHYHHHRHHHYSSEQDEGEGGGEDLSFERTKHHHHHRHHNKIRHEDHRRIHNHNKKYTHNNKNKNQRHQHQADDSSEWLQQQQQQNYNNQKEHKKILSDSVSLQQRHETESKSLPNFTKINNNNNNNTANKKILQDGPLQRVINHYPEIQKIHIKHGLTNQRISSDKFGLHVTSHADHLSSSQEEDGDEKEEVKNLAHDDFNPSKNDSTGDIIKDRTILKFRLSARNLPSKDKIGLSDPYVIVSYADDSLKSFKGAKDKIVLSQSSVILNNNDPVWGESFQFEYEKKKNQRWHFAIMDKDIFHGSDDLIGIVWIKVKYYVDNGQFLKIPIQLETEVDGGSNLPLPLLIIKHEI